MKNRFPVALFIFLIAVLSSGNAGKAQASDSIPQNIQRNWALPDCGNYEEALVLSRYFYLKSTEKDMTLLPATVDSKKKDFWILDLGGEETPVQLQEDGVLKIGAWGDSRRGSEWDKLSLAGSSEYTGCVEPPKLVPKVMLRMMRFIDRIKDQCTVSVTNECAGVLFKMADEDSSKKLTKKEIEKAVSATIIFAALADKKTLPDKESLALIKSSKADGTKIANLLLATYDKDKSKSLDYNELMEDFKAPDMPIVKDTLLKAGVLLPSFKLAAMGLD